MKKNNRKILGVGLALGIFLLAEPAFATTLLDSTQSKFEIAAAAFGSRIKILGLELLFALAGVQLVVNMTYKMLGTIEMEDVMFALAKFMLTTGFFVAMIQGAETYLPMVIHSFEFIGQKGSGMDNLTPSTIITQGIQLQNLMVAKFNAATGADGSLLSAMRNIFPALMLMAVCLIILISFIILAAQMALTMISAYFWMALTPVLMGFGGLQYTREIAVTSIKGGITIGMKILVVYLLAGVAAELAPMWGDGMGEVTLTDWSPMFWVMSGAMILAYLSFQLPKLAGDLLNGTASLSAGDAGTNMTMIGAMAAGGVAAGAGALNAAGAGSIGAAAIGAAGHALSTAAKALGAGMNELSNQFSGASSPEASESPASEAGAGSGPSAAAAGNSTPSKPTPETIPDYKSLLQNKSSNAGGATPPSIGGANQATSNGPKDKPNRPTTAQRIRMAGDALPDDGHTVGLNAGISSQQSGE